MTRDEIDELIKELEATYHVDCIYIPSDGEYSMPELRIVPNLYMTFLEPLYKD